MNETVRYIIAGILIFLILLLTPIYQNWLGYDSRPTVVVEDDSKPSELNSVKNKLSYINDYNLSNTETKNHTNVNNDYHDIIITTIDAPLYTAKISNRSGGSFVSYKMKNLNSRDKKFSGGYDDDGVFFQNTPTSLILPSNNSCMPCLGQYDENLETYSYFNQPFTIISTNRSDSISLGLQDTVSLSYELSNKNGLILRKTVQFFGDSYFTNHSFVFGDTHTLTNNIELIWADGLRPTEQKEAEDVQYAKASVGQAKEVDKIFMSDANSPNSREVFNGTTDWVSIRTKYFTSAIIIDSPGKYAALKSNNVVFGGRKHTPVYSAGIGIASNVKSVSSKIYIGPLDVQHLSTTKYNLDATMDWGIFIIKPISKGILWILKFAHDTFKLNYGVILLLFAIAIRIITGPLTKKSFESSQNMQKIQPDLKKIQSKYKSDPSALNRETMALYKKHGVNPLGGCLPILLQMPLLFALFQVFRSTIEFRGAPFILWISDLSKPDVVWAPAFLKNIWGLNYFFGDGVAVLPIIMGITLMLTMRMSSSTMDPSQKPIMYTMNAFFVLLFNTFPSGLNLYYTAYNILSFFQQRSIRHGLADK